MPGKRYTREEKQEKVKIIRKAYEGGATIRKAGRAAGVSEQTAKRWMLEDGVQLRQVHGRNEIEYDPEDLRKLADEGLTEAEIAKKMHASKTTVGVWMKKNGIEINLEARRGRQPAEKASKGEEKKTKPVKKCKTCIYRSGVSGYGCNYNLIMKKSRRCRVIGCIRYVEGKRLRLAEDFTGA